MAACPKWLISLHLSAAHKNCDTLSGKSANTKKAYLSDLKQFSIWLRKTYRENIYSGPVKLDHKNETEKKHYSHEKEYLEWVKRYIAGITYHRLL
jgi:hypothetical protein